MKTRKLLALIISFNLIFSSTFVYAANLDNLSSQKNSVDSKKGTVQKEINQIKSEKKNVQSQINALSEKIQLVQSTLVNINGKLVNNEKKINDLDNEINETNKKILEQEETLKTRLKVFYENGNITYLDILLDSGDLTDFITRVDIVNKIVVFDKSVLGDMEESKEKLNKDKGELEKSKKEIIESKKQYEVFKQQHLENKKLKDELISELSEEQKKAEREYEQLQRESLQIAQQIQNSQRGTKDTIYVGGALAWPTPGYTAITSPFGNRYHPIYKTNRFHSGIDIGAPAGAKVIAANSGTVISASYMQGYGNTIIVDHGGGLATLYAHNTSLVASVGQKVSRGDTIAKVGSTGNSTGPHCHFEVRKNGQAVNPMSYLK